MKILYVTTVGGTMRFFKSLINELIDENNEVDIACNRIETIPDFYLNLNCQYYKIDCSRSPLNFGNIKAIEQLKKLIYEKKYDIIHCHTPIASICTRIACRKFRKNNIKVFYTAHGFHFYKGSPFKNWLIYYPIEKICSHWTDKIFTINKEDFRLAKNKLKCKEVIYIPGIGVDTDCIFKTEIDKVKKRKEIGIKSEDFVIISVGELNKNKNQLKVIEALNMLKKDKKIAKIKYLICGSGDYYNKIIKKIKKYKLEENVKLLGFRNDVIQLNLLSDLFIFPSYREGLPVSLMEAMACKLPIICSKIRGNIDLIKNDKLLFNPNSKKEILDSLKFMLSLSENDLLKIGCENKKIVENFDKKIVNKIIKDNYFKGEIV